MNIHGGGGGGWNAHLLKIMGGGGQDEKIGGLHKKNHWGGGLKLWAFHPHPPPPPHVYSNGIALSFHILKMAIISCMIKKKYGNI